MRAQRVRGAGQVAWSLGMAAILLAGTASWAPAGNRSQAQPVCTVDTDCLPGQACVDGQCGPGPEPCTPSPEACTDGIDNDCDGAIDGNDSDCVSRPQEVCGDCADNDANGLIDFEDPACCALGATYVMDLSKGRIVPKGAVSYMRISSTLARGGMVVDPLKQDVYLQIRDQNGRDILCAKAPAKEFMKRGKTFKFSVGKKPVPSAQGIHDMKVKIRRDGSIVFKAFGKRVQMTNVQDGPLHVTVGFKGATDADNRCSDTRAEFKATKGAALIAR